MYERNNFQHFKWSSRCSSSSKQKFLKALIPLHLHYFYNEQNYCKFQTGMKFMHFLSIFFPNKTFLKEFSILFFQFWIEKNLYFWMEFMQKCISSRFPVITSFPGMFITRKQLLAVFLNL